MDELTEQVAAGLQRGSPQAWSKLYRTYSERLWREVARLIGPNAADVPDVVQEVFLAAAKSARQFDPARGSLWAWLMGIARREVALRYRKQASRLENARRWWGTLDGSAKHWVAGSGDAPLDVLESRELGSLVRATLLELSDDYQMLLTRKYLDGASGEEIARETDGTPEGVRAKLMRARRAFRKVFLKLARHDLDGSRSQGHGQE